MGTERCARWTVVCRSIHRISAGRIADSAPALPGTRRRIRAVDWWRLRAAMGSAPSPCARLFSIGAWPGSDHDLHQHAGRHKLRWASREISAAVEFFLERGSGHLSDSGSRVASAFFSKHNVSRSGMRFGAASHGGVAQTVEPARSFNNTALHPPHSCQRHCFLRVHGVSLRRGGSVAGWLDGYLHNAHTLLEGQRCNGDGFCLLDIPAGRERRSGFAFKVRAGANPLPTGSCWDATRHACPVGCAQPACHRGWSRPLRRGARATFPADPGVFYGAGRSFFPRWMGIFHLWFWRGRACLAHWSDFFADGFAAHWARSPSDGGCALDGHGSRIFSHNSEVARRAFQINALSGIHTRRVEKLLVEITVGARGKR